MDFKEKSKPIYLQIADRICDDVAQGIYPADSRLPSVREYAAAVQVNANTVMRAYEHLAWRGVIFNKRGIGFFIHPDAIDKIAEIRNETFFNDEINYFFSRLATIGVTAEQLSNLYINYINSSK